MELSNKDWKSTKKLCLNQNSTMDHHSNIVCGNFFPNGVHFEFSHAEKYYEFEQDVLYWFHRYSTFGFTRDFIVEYSTEFLQFFQEVSPANNTLIKYDPNAKHNLLLSFRCSAQLSLSKKEIPYFFRLIKPQPKDLSDSDDEK